MINHMFFYNMNEHNFLLFIGGIYKQRSGRMETPFEPRRREIQYTPLPSHPASWWRVSTGQPTGPTPFCQEDATSAE